MTKRILGLGIAGAAALALALPAAPAHAHHCVEGPFTEPVRCTEDVLYSLLKAA